MAFRVNDNTVFTSDSTYSGGRARVVLAGLQATANTVPWGVKHNLTSVRNIYLKNSAKTWVLFSSRIGDYDAESWGSANPPYYDPNWHGSSSFTANLLL